MKYKFYIAALAYFLFCDSSLAQYCIPDTISLDPDFGITYVGLKNLSNASNLEEGYIDFSSTTDTPTLFIGETFEIAVIGSPTVDQKLYIWIDWRNTDNNWAQSDENVIGPEDVTAGTDTFKFTFPLSCRVDPNKYVRMRVKMGEDNGTAEDICFLENHDIEDYIVKVEFLPSQDTSYNTELCNLIPNYDLSFGICNEASGYTSSDMDLHLYPGSAPTMAIPYHFEGAATTSNFFGSQAPLAGTGFIGVQTYDKNPVADVRHYIQLPLISPLENGKSYCAEFHASRADNSQYATNGLGMFFSTSKLDTNTIETLPITPQITSNTVITDTSNWTPINGEFIATGQERYIIIGGFYDDSQLTLDSSTSPRPEAFYYIDKIGVYPKEDIVLSYPDTVCKGEAFSVNASNPCSYEIFDIHNTLLSSNAPLQIDSINGDTSFIVQSSHGSTLCEDIDTITIHFCKDSIIDSIPPVIAEPMDTLLFYIPNAFSPNNNIENSNFGIIINQVPEQFEMVIYDRFGQLVFHSDNHLDHWDGRLFNNQLASTGVYVWKVHLKWKQSIYDLIGSCTLLK